MLQEHDLSVRSIAYDAPHGADTKRIAYVRLVPPALPSRSNGANPSVSRLSNTCLLATLGQALLQLFAEMSPCCPVALLPQMCAAEVLCGSSARDAQHPCTRAILRLQAACLEIAWKCASTGCRDAG